MKRLLFLVALLLMVGGATAQKKEGQTIYLVDGKVVTEQEFKAIPSGKITNMNVMKGVKSVVVASTEDVEEESNEMIITGFSKDSKVRVLHMASSEKAVKSTIGAKVENGKIVVTPQLQGSDEKHGVVTTISAKSGENIKVTSKSLKLDERGDPVILIIDSEGNTNTVKKEKFSEIDAAKIESMTVLKQEQAHRIYGNQYGDLKDGIIVIKLRNTEADATPEEQAEKIITVRGDNSVGESLLDKSGEPALYLGDKNPTLLLTDADGKTSIVESFSNVRNDDIESFDVIKDEKKKAEYEKKYGPSKDGYVHIVLKKNK